MFVDSTRSAGATVVAAYSQRYRPRVTVSIPESCDEIDDVSPSVFTNGDAVERLCERDTSAEAMPEPQSLSADLVADGHGSPVARVAAMHEGKRRARAKRTGTRAHRPRHTKVPNLPDGGPR